jgi:hypothetical protein
MPLLAVPRGASVEMVQIFLRWRLTASRYSVSPRRKGGLSNLRHDIDVRSDLYFFVQLDDVRVVHAKAAMRDGAAD